jgi:hypothetical protein
LSSGRTPEVFASIRASYANYEACLSGGLRLVPKGALLKALAADYAKMIAAGMFEGEPPTFDAIVGRLDELSRQINTR